MWQIFNTTTNMCAFLDLTRDVQCLIYDRMDIAARFKLNTALPRRHVITKTLHTDTKKDRRIALVAHLFEKQPPSSSKDIPNGFLKMMRDYADDPTIKRLLGRVEGSASFAEREDVQLALMLSDFRTGYFANKASYPPGVRDGSFTGWFQLAGVIGKNSLDAFGRMLEDPYACFLFQIVLTRSMEDFALGLLGSDNRPVLEFIVTRHRNGTMPTWGLPADIWTTFMEQLYVWCAYGAGLWVIYDEVIGMSESQKQDLLRRTILGMRFDIAQHLIERGVRLKEG